MENTNEITQVVLKAADKARNETTSEPEPEHTRPADWPISCTVGPGLEGAIACESKIGYVNGSKGWLIYRGYDIFDLCAYSTFEEVSYLLLHGELPSASQLSLFKNKLVGYREMNHTTRTLMGFPIEEMNTMAALRIGTTFMRQKFTYLDKEEGRPTLSDAIAADEDSIAMETTPKGDKHAIYEFKHKKTHGKRKSDHENINNLEDGSGIETCYHLISGLATITAAISRVKHGHMPLEPDPELSHAANLLYMITGKKPSPCEERVMDIALILHADHGMNASTFATMVVASTLSDLYFSVGSGIAALNGPLHGGANEQVMNILKEIGSSERVKPWVDDALKKNRKIVGFGHRVYKAYDPRARVLGPLAELLVNNNNTMKPLFKIAKKLEGEVLSTLGAKKKIFPNVDYYSGIVYSCLGISSEMFTPIFAVSRISGWTARVYEYLQNNRIFRPRALYVGDFNKKYAPLNKRK